MGLFQWLFEKKSNKTNDTSVGVEARRKATNDFKIIAQSLGLVSFDLQVGHGNDDLDTLFIISDIPNDPNVAGFLQYSLLKPNTAKNLMSIGFNRVATVDKNTQKVKFIELYKYAQ